MIELLCLFVATAGMAKASKNASRTSRRTKATAKEAAELINPAMRGMHEDIAEALEKAGKEREEFEDRLSETVQAESSKILAGQSNILTTQKKERRDEGAAMRAWMTENLKPAGAASAAELAQAKSERDAQQRRALKFKDDVDALSKSQKATEEEYKAQCNKWRNEKRTARLDAKQEQAQKEAAEKALRKEQAQREDDQRELQKKAEEAARLAELVAK